VYGSVSDPYSFDRYGSESGILSWIPTRIRIQGFDDQKWKKFTFEKKIKKCYQKQKFTYPKASKLQKKPSALKRKHPALQNRKCLCAAQGCTFFIDCQSLRELRITSVIIIAIAQENVCEGSSVTVS
jgi:hypothetical protein